VDTTANDNSRTPRATTPLEAIAHIEGAEITTVILTGRCARDEGLFEFLRASYPSVHVVREA
jgi:hypothetical protein